MRRLKILALDLILIAVATVSALLLRDNLELSVQNLTAIMPYSLISLACAIVILPLAGINKTLWRFSGLNEYWRLLFSCAAIVMSSVLIGFATLRMENVPRSLPIIQAIIMVALMVGMRVMMRVHRFRHGREAAPPQPEGNQESVIIVGLNTVAELFIQAVAENPNQKIAIAGVIGRGERHTGHLFRSHPVLGTPEEIPQVLRDLDVHGVAVDRIVVTIPFERLTEDARQALLDIENGSQIKIDYFAERLGFVDAPEVAAAHRSAGDASRISRTAGDAGAELKALQSPYWRTKRRIDIVLSSLAILALTPVMMAIGLLTALVHGMPILFWQQRPGLNGRPFKVYKFRSLLGAHDEQGQRLPDALRETWLGRIMRATRMDELPQLFNIFKGHMTFVGPRPLLTTDQLEQFSSRLLVRPGLTGWAQVNGGKSVSASDKMALDIWYIKNASFALDLKIVWLTAYMVVFGERQNPDAVEQAWVELRRHKA